MEYIVFLCAFFLSFFALHSLSKNDFVLIRKNISIDTIFDRAFIVLLFAFILSRIFYIWEVGRIDYLHLLRFFYFLKYPGFSLIGAFVGIGLSLLLVFRENKILLRIYDIFFLSFFPLLFGHVIVAQMSGYFIVLKIALFIFTAVLYGFLLNSHRNYSVKDGSITLLVVFLVAFNTFATQMVSTGKIFVSLFSISQLLSLGLLMVSLLLLFINQRVLSKKSR